jgi:hypothetical protein
VRGWELFVRLFACWCQVGVIPEGMYCGPCLNLDSFAHYYGIFKMICHHIASNQCEQGPAISPTSVHIRILRINVSHAKIIDITLPTFAIAPPSEIPIFSNGRSHAAGVCTISPHPCIPHLVATGSYDDHVRLWDMRLMSRPLLITKVRVHTGCMDSVPCSFPLAPVLPS